MKRLNALLQRQPWVFLIHGLAFGGSLYLAQWLPIIGGSAIGVWMAVFGGLVWASAMSAVRAIRDARREARERISSAGPFRWHSDG